MEFCGGERMGRIKGLTDDRKRGLWRLALVLYLCVVYGHSMMPAHVSSGESGAVLEFLQKLMDLIGLNREMLTEHIVRKAAHFTEYAGVGILLWGGGFHSAERVETPPRIRSAERVETPPRVRSAERVALAVIVIPFVDETIQLFVAGRSGQISDVWLDMAGVAVGLLASWVWSRWKEKG